MPIKSARTLVDAALAEVTTLPVDAAQALLGTPGVRFVDLREAGELAREGTLPGALHVPRGVLEFRADPASEWRQAELVEPGTRLVLFCAIGWRSALAAKALQDMGHPAVCHLGGGFAAWRAAGAPVAPVELTLT